MKILIDNGHGENTPGKHSPDRTLHEWRWNREVASMLERELTRRGLDVMRICPEDADVSISERCRRVNEICRNRRPKDVLLVSVHVNAAGADGRWHGARGWSVFVSKSASAASKECAGIFTAMAKERGMTGNRTVPDCGYWTWSWTTADIGILKGTVCPAILTENFFMDNAEDLAWIRSEAGKRQCVELHADAICRYAREHEG